MSSDTISVVFPTDEWEALKDLLDGEGAPLNLMGDLEQRGFLENGALSQSAAKLLQAYQQAAGAVRLYVCDAGVVREARTWVAKDRSVLLDITDGEVTVLRRQEPGHFPLTLLEMLGIGPRPRLPEGALPGFSARIIRARATATATPKPATTSPRRSEGCGRPPARRSKRTTGGCGSFSPSTSPSASLRRAPRCASSTRRPAWSGSRSMATPRFPWP